jgi:N6-L-threonylcarbamoyladenine synthase
MPRIILLAIESSCDDTSAAIIIDGRVASNVTANQTVHKEYGGVVPELASRSHQENIVPVVDKALKEAGVSSDQLCGITFTRGPGLLGSLIVGVSFAKALALGLKIPLIEVHHMHAHVMAHFAEDPKPTFPFLCLTVSGGHTQIVLVKGMNDMEVLGETIDDAAGEAFDKTGKILGLKYPAGPIIDRLAQRGTPRFTYAKPRMEGYKFSFSGLKTSILYTLRKQVKTNENFVQENLNDICASVQETIIDILMDKLVLASEELQITEIAIAGGVSANSGLRKRLEEIGKERGWNTFIPAFQYCTDNAAMIGISGYYKYLENDFVGQDITPEARLEF